MHKTVKQALSRDEDARRWNGDVVSIQGRPSTDDDGRLIWLVHSNGRRRQELFGLTTAEIEWLQSGVLSGATQRTRARRSRLRLRTWHTLVDAAESAYPCCANSDIALTSSLGTG
jgi:hypothetical protein